MRVILALITVGLTIYALVDCLRSTDEEVRNLPRTLWLLVILVPIAGGLAWLTFGRPSGEQPAPTSRPLAPDDDPEFLQSLDRTFRERRRRAAEEARRRRRAEEARRQAEQEAEHTEPRRGGRPGNGKPGGKPSGGTPERTGGQPNGAAPSPSTGPDGDDPSGRQAPA